MITTGPVSSSDDPTAEGDFRVDVAHWTQPGGNGRLSVQGYFSSHNRHANSEYKPIPKPGIIASFAGFLTHTTVPVTSILSLLSVDVDYISFVGQSPVPPRTPASNNSKGKGLFLCLSRFISLIKWYYLENASGKRFGFSFKTAASSSSSFTPTPTPTPARKRARIEDEGPEPSQAPSRAAQDSEEPAQPAPTGPVDYDSSSDMYSESTGPSNTPSGSGTHHD